MCVSMCECMYVSLCVYVCLHTYIICMTKRDRNRRDTGRDRHGNSDRQTHIQIDGDKEEGREREKEIHKK